MNIGDDCRRRIAELCRLTDEFFDTMPLQERDRWMQIHLAQARGSKLNLQLLCEMTDMVFELRPSQSRTGEA